MKDVYLVDMSKYKDMLAVIDYARKQVIKQHGKDQEADIKVSVHRNMPSYVVEVTLL